MIFSIECNNVNIYSSAIINNYHSIYRMATMTIFCNDKYSLFGAETGLFHEDLVNIMTDGALDIGRQIVD